MTMQTAIGTALPGTSTPPDARILMGAEVLPGSEEQVRRILDSITDAFIVASSIPNGASPF
jgi:hypothetical protein